MKPKLKILDLFSGIGGFSLGLERTGGFETIAFCEIDPYCQKVLKKHWPNVPIYEDVTKLDGRQITADVITGGFPYQDISVAGKQAGIEGKRSGLWTELHRVIGEVRPKYAVVENVTALLSGDRGGWFGRVLGDLAEIGYDTEWHCIPAYYIGSPQERDRVWLVAYPKRRRLQGSIFKPFDFSEKGIEWSQQLERLHDAERRLAVSTGKYRKLSDGLRFRAHRLRGLGNAVVPQIPEIIGKAILEAENTVRK